MRPTHFKTPNVGKASTFCTSWSFVIVGLVLLSNGEALLGGHYSDPTGFSFKYPEGWVPITRTAMSDANEGLSDDLRAWITKNNVNLNQIEVILVHNTPGEFRANINVVADDQQIPIDEDALKKLADAIAQQHEKLGLQSKNFQSHIQQFGSRETLVIEYQTRLPGIPFDLQQIQVVFPGGGKSYIVTCTSPSDKFLSYRPKFERILASFQVPPPIAQGFNWDRISLAGILGAIVGALVAGVASIVVKKKLSRNATSKQSAAAPPQRRNE